MTSSQIRQQFLDFFKDKEHAIVPSSPVVPHDDPTLMFTNAGMNQFKDVFLGSGSRDYARAADTQKCIRAGGKHNDLDDVGQDTYHHTFFEMLGNWSFGDYFKKEAIAWAWELLTEVWGIDKSRLYTTYFEGDADLCLEPDGEAKTLWQEVTDIDPSHIVPGNKKDNFWEMGDTGPCGPCSEIHIDLTPDKSGGHLVNAGDHRVIEIWNLVFIQFNRSPDGKLSPLPAQHVDTGMGFERLCAVLQGMEANRLGDFTNYDTDVFTPIFNAIQKRTGAPDYKGTLPTNTDQQSSDPDQVMVDVSYRVIADHLRCLTFALTDGAIPSNEGRGYVLRRILRRAVRYGRQYFNMHEPFLCDMVQSLVDHMGKAFPELHDSPAYGKKNVERVVELLRDEEDSFGKTLDRGIKLFNEAADHATKHHHGKISGEDAFKLHDTYGFPIDLTELMAEEAKLTIDIGEYERLMEEARTKARAGGTDSDRARILNRIAGSEGFVRDTKRSTRFVGYENSTSKSPIRWIETTTGSPSELQQDQYGALVLRDSPFYAEKGGQVGDRGTIKSETGVFQVEDVQDFAGRHIHFGRCVHGSMFQSISVFMGTQSVEPGDHKHVQLVTAGIDESYRRPIMQNHTSTHVLNWALRGVLGTGVQQKGSLVDPEKTRFDFSHNKPVTAEELGRIESLVAEQIEAAYPVYTQEVDQAEALKINTLRAVFGEKYPDRVRVVSVGANIDDMLADPENREWMKYSVEFCGGTHLQKSSEAECFALITEEGVAKGVRRVVGITGSAAREARQCGTDLLTELGLLAESESEDLAAQVTAIQTKINESVIPVVVRHQLREKLAGLQKVAKEQAKQASAQSGQSAMDQVASLLESAKAVGDVTVVVGEISGASADALRGAVDWVRNKTDASAVLLASGIDGKVTLIAGMSKGVVAKGVKAGDLIKEIAPTVGGKGGGRPDMAQGGGNMPEKIGDALQTAQEWLNQKLG